MPALLAALLVTIGPGAAVQPEARAAEVYARAVALEARGEDAAALTLLWEAAGLAPRDAEIQTRLGEALERVGALDAAVDAYRVALAARPSFRRAANNLVLALAKSGRGLEAVAQARALAAAAPGDADRLFTLGLALSEQDVEEAMATFRRVIAAEPRHALARYNLALVLKRADRLPDAVAELQRVIAIDPRPEALYTLGVIYWQQGELDRAAAALRAAIAAEPRHAEAYHALGAVLHAGRDHGAAADALRRAVALRPDAPPAHDTLARVLQAAGDRAGAARHRDEAARLRERARVEQEARVWTSVGVARLDAGDAGGALECFGRATAIFEPYAPAHYQRGRALHQLGRADAARAAFARARQLNPSLVPPPDVR